MKKGKSLSFVFATLGAATLVAACGGNDEEAAPAEPAPAEPAPAESPAEPPAEPAAGGTTLQGHVGPGFTIELTQDGNPVTQLAAGTYTIVVNDEASSHNFHLAGPGVDEATDVGGTGETTFQVTLEAGDYTFVCDPHASSMNGAFTVS
jgi:copper binding plastocyanin/azurin family protein